MKMARVPRFKEGRAYRCMDGTMITVVKCHNNTRGYETVLCSDDIHRYNRSIRNKDNGRVTGTDHDFGDPRNLDPRQIGGRLPKSYVAPQKV